MGPISRWVEESRELKRLRREKVGHVRRRKDANGFKIPTRKKARFRVSRENDEPVSDGDVADAESSSSSVDVNVDDDDCDDETYADVTMEVCMEALGSPKAQACGNDTA